MENENQPKFADNEVQTDKTTSLPWETCIENDVRAHPAVASGSVDFALATVFIPDVDARKETTKRRVLETEAKAGV